MGKESPISSWPLCSSLSATLTLMGPPGGGGRHLPTGSQCRMWPPLPPIQGLPFQEKNSSLSPSPGGWRWGSPPRSQLSSPFTQSPPSARWLAFPEFLDKRGPCFYNPHPRICFIDFRVRGEERERGEISINCLLHTLANNQTHDLFGGTGGRSNQPSTLPARAGGTSDIAKERGTDTAI